MLASDSLPARVSMQQRELVAGAIVALLALAAYLVWRVTEAPIAEPPAPTVIRSLVVLPLQGDEELLAYGVADELATALASVPGVRIAPAPPGFARDRRSSDDLRELATMLNVGAVLHGTLRRSGPELQLTMQLTSIGDDSTLWNVAITRDTGDLAALENEVARSVARALWAQVGLPAASVVAVTTTDRVAHALAMRAAHLRRQGTRAALDSAADLLDDAVRRDSAYARAWSALAGTSAREARATEAARRAIALDSTLAEPHVAMGRLSAATGDTGQALREYLVAIRRDPRLASARYEYSRLLSRLRRSDEALREARRAHELDPLSPDFHMNYAEMLSRAGHDANAKQELAELRRITKYLTSH